MKYAVVICSLGLILLPSVRADFNPPVLVRSVPPVFPDAMRREHVNGVVLVSCEVDSQGNVSDTKVEKASNAEFTEPALAALKKWKFKPAQRDGNVIAIRVSIPIKFTLED
jgi:protein TonB